MTGHDPAGIARALLPWLERRLPDAAIKLPVPQLPSAGASSETYILAPRIVEQGETRTWRMVLRLQATGQAIYQEPSVEREYRLLETLGRASAAPVPRALWLETDSSVLGAPFLIMEHVEGDIPGSLHHSTGYLTEIGAGAREAAWLSAIEAMAKLHTADPADFAFMGPPAGGLDAELVRWERYMRWAEIPVRPVQERALRWLSDHRPRHEVTGLAWGDARPENMIFRDHRCIAVIDWETASLGGAETDLGWWLFYDWMVSESFGVPRLKGLPGREETLAQWEAFAGRKLLDMEWHEAFATWRFSLIADRALMLAWKDGQAGTPPPGAPSPYAQRLEDLIGG